MKKILSLAVIVSAIALLAGCASQDQDSVIGPVAPNAGTVAVSLSINTQKVGVVAKKLANSGAMAKVSAQTSVNVQPNILLIWCGPINCYVDPDTVRIKQNPMTLNYTLQENTSYSVSISARDSLNMKVSLNGGATSFTTPTDSDSLTVFINLPASVVGTDFAAPLKGSAVQNTACSVSVRYDAIVVNQGGWTNYDFVAFTPGTLDTARLSTLLQVNYAYNATARFVNLDKSYYQGSMATPVIVPGVDYSIVIPLVYYDKNGVVVSFAGTLQKVATATFRVSGI